MKLAKVLLGIFLFVIATITSYSQYNFTAPSIVKFPLIRCGFFNYNPDNNYKASDFEVSENGKIIPDSLVTVNCDESVAPIQVLLLIDQSTSMGQLINGKSKIDIVKESAISFINKVQLNDFSAVGILGFGAVPNLYCGFTNNKAILYNKLAILNTIPSSTDFNNAFLNPTQGAISLLSNQPNLNRCIIFLTDGNHDEELQGVFRSAEVSAALAANNIKLYSISFLSNYNASLQAISNEYYQVDETGVLPDVYDQLAEKLTSYPFCNILWQTQIPCEGSADETQVTIKYIPMNYIFNTSYNPPASSIFHLISDKSYYYFGNPVPDQSTDLDITVKPTPYNILISNIYPSDPNYYQIVDYGNGATSMPSGGINIGVDKNYTFKVRFTQKVDQSARTADLIVEGTPCDKIIKLYGGIGNITLTNPKKDDVFSDCNGVQIKWVGVPSDALKDLYYENGNNNWQVIVKDISGDEYFWKQNLPEGDYYIKIVAHLNLGAQITLQDSSEVFHIEIPIITSSISTINKDSVIVGSTQTTPYIDIFENNFHFPIQIVDWEITGTCASEYSIQDIKGITIDPAAKASLVVTFTPLDFGPRPAKLTLTTDCGKHLDIDLVCYGLCSAINKEEVNFGTGFINSEKDSIVDMILYNAMNKAIVFTPYLSGANKKDFVIIGVYPGEKITVPPYQPYTLKLGFTPKTTGIKTAFVNFPIEGCRTVETKLIGKAIREGLQINNLDFGRLLSKSLFPTLELKIINKDLDSVQLTSLNFLDDKFKPIFQLGDITLPSYLKGNDTLIIPVNFYPPGIDKYSTQLQLISSIGDTLISNLKGEVFLPSLKLETICADNTPDDSTGISYLMIINDGFSSGVQVHSYGFSYPSDEFNWAIKPLRDFNINLSDTFTVPILYKPNPTGSHQTEIYVEADNHDNDFPSKWYVNFIELQCEKASFDFTYTDKQHIMACDEFMIPLEITNKSSSVDLFIDLDKAEISGLDANSYKIDQSGVLKISPKYSKTIYIQFSASHKGEYNAHVLIPTTVDNNIEFDLINYGESFTAVSDIEEATLKPGEEVSPTITITPPNIVKDSIDGIRSTIRYNSDLLYYEGAEQNIGSTNELKSKYWIINSDRIAGKIDFHYLGQLSKVDKYIIKPKFLCLIGGPETTKIGFQINYPCFIDSNLFITIHRSNVCMSDLRNVIIGNINSYLNSPIPNPTTGDIELDFGLGIKAKTVINLFDLSGKIVKVLDDEILNEGTYTKKYNISSLSSGTYYLKFKSANYEITYVLIKEN